MAASTVVTVGQLSQVATAQKSYIDAKDTELRTSLAKEVSDGDKAIQDQLDALEIPQEATEAEVKEILDIFSTGTGAE